MVVNITSKLILFVPVFFSIMWHIHNTGIPTADAIGWLMSANTILLNLTQENNFLGFLWDLMSHRPWRPVIFHLFVVPFLLITDGNILLTVGIIHAIFVSMSVFFLYKIFSFFSNKILASLSASIIAMTQHVQFGGIQIPLFAEVGLISFSLGAFYFLIKSDYFSNRKSSLYFAIFLSLALVTRPIEGIFYIVCPLIIFILFAIKINKVNLHYFISVARIPLTAISLLFLTRIIDSKSISSIDPDNSYKIFLISALVIFFITAIFYILEKLIRNEKNINHKNYLKKIFIVVSVLIFIWWAPYFSNLYEWVYRTSLGDIVSSYVVNKDYFGKISRIAYNTGSVPLLTILFFAVIVSAWNIIKNKSLFSDMKNTYINIKIKETFIILSSSIIIPMSLYLFTIQSSDRKITTTAISFFMIIIIYFISHKQLKGLRYLILVPILLLQSYAATLIINSNQTISFFGEGKRSKEVTYILGDLYPFPVNIDPNPHFVVLNELELITKKYKIKNVATIINDTGIPVDPFQLSLLSMQKIFSSSFPYTRSFEKDNFEFVNQYEAILLINPLGKMSDSKKQIKILEKVQEVGALEAGVLKQPASNNQKYLFLFQYYYAKNKLDSMGWKELECFDIDKTYSGCVFLNINKKN